MNAEAEIPLIRNIQKKVKVQIESEEGKPEEHIIKEMTGEDYDEFQIWNANRVKTDPKTGKAVGVLNFKDSMAMMISKCLHKVEADGDKPVSLQKIRKFTASTQEALLKICMEMHGVKNQKEDAKKKEGEESIEQESD